MISATAALLLKFVALFLVVVAVVDLLTMSEERRIRLHRQQGLTQKAIAERLGITTYRVRKALA